MSKEYNCVRKTKKAFEDSLILLTKEYPFNKITIRMLCEQADLSRNAFYFHYQDINELLDSIEDRLYNELTGFFDDIDRRAFPDNILFTIQRIIDIYEDNSAVLGMLNSLSIDNSLVYKVSKAYSDFNYKYFAAYHQNTSRDKYNYYYMFISGGFYNMLKMWLDDPSVMSKEELTKMSYTFIKRLLVKGNPDIHDVIEMNSMMRRF